MMPWGHLAFGYVLYSLGHRFVTRKPPAGFGVVLAIVVGTQLPDVVDKTLSWGLHLFPQGYSIAHSILVAVPVGLLILGVTAFRSRDIGIAFVLAYWSHLVGDAMLAVPKRGVSPGDRLLWPIVTLPPYRGEPTLFGQIERIFSTFFNEMLTTEHFLFLAIYTVPYLLVFSLWVIDGSPGIAFLWRKENHK
ncbi:MULTISPECIES: metal-dependent hydrolase [Natrinema]|uniref:Metal-dependent hydrolase n=1 Tax=Natrinema salsiterrestre TaxID=2950540 RepID=A0A9Q4L9E3_9EURY|nr:MULTISPECIES: metal-dependent hydrolase [Natrinema]MDF9748475.1 metal-dependent hydrolase [Natrinema salsiterrestre]